MWNYRAMRDTKGEVGGVEFCHGKPKPEIDSALKIYLKAFNIFLCIYVCVKENEPLQIKHLQYKLLELTSYFKSRFCRGKKLLKWEQKPRPWIGKKICFIKPNNSYIFQHQQAFHPVLDLTQKPLVLGNFDKATNRNIGIQHQMNFRLTFKWISISNLSLKPSF